MSDAIGYGLLGLFGLLWLYIALYWLVVGLATGGPALYEIGMAIVTPPIEALGLPD